jgi:hypothetical protein
LPCLGASGQYAENIVRYWTGSSRNAGAHLVVNFDGSVVNTADLQTEQTYHAGTVNDVTVGIEICQKADGSLYSVQLDFVVRLIDWITATMGIQRQFHDPYHGGPVERIHAGGHDVCGVYAHRDQTSNRGRGDPGDEIFARLFAAGYERFDCAAGIDLAVWKTRQQQLGLPTVDGVPGPETCRALAAKGFASGMWVARP